MHRARKTPASILADCFIIGGDYNNIVTLVSTQTLTNC